MIALAADIWLLVLLCGLYVLLWFSCYCVEFGFIVWVLYAVLLVVLHMLCPLLLILQVYFWVFVAPVCVVCLFTLSEFACDFV